MDNVGVTKVEIYRDAVLVKARAISATSLLGLPSSLAALVRMCRRFIRSSERQPRRLGATNYGISINFHFCNTDVIHRPTGYPYRPTTLLELSEGVSNDPNGGVVSGGPAASLMVKVWPATVMFRYVLLPCSEQRCKTHYRFRCQTG